jgi:hypothetical protein
MSFAGPRLEFVFTHSAARLGIVFTHFSRSPSLMLVRRTGGVCLLPTSTIVFSAP